MSSGNVLRARASRSCGNCRAIKRRCDQQVPHCGQCIRMREACPGYRDEWELVFRDQTDRTIKRSKEKRAKQKALTGANRSTPPPRELGANVDQIGVNFFLHNFITSDQSPSRGYLNYIPVVFSADAEHPTLLASMAAVGLVALANSSRRPELVKHARVKYSEAISSVNAALASPVECVKDSILMSVISLGVFEYVSNFESWVRHVQGAATLAMARGKRQFTTKAGILMFNQLRADLIIACIQANQPFPEGIRELQQEAARHANTQSGFWMLGVVATRVPTLMYNVGENKGEVPWSDLLQEAVLLHQDCESVFAFLAIEEPYTIIQDPGADPNLVHDGRFDLYRSSWAIRVWNNARCIQMVVCRILLYLLQKMFATDLDPVTRQRLNRLFHDTQQTLSKLGDDILSTAPQVLGFVSSGPERTVAFNPSAQPSVSGCYTLVWPLTMVGRCPVTASHSRKWIMRRLLDIGESAGISLALQLLEEVVKADRV
ncbi:Zn(II)2Cys6 transcription factor domain-containing protein, partial [Aspergillus ibericus CBS 121593]